MCLCCLYVFCSPLDVGVASASGALTNAIDVAALVANGGLAQPKPAEPKTTVVIADGLDNVDMVSNLSCEVWCVCCVL